MAALRRRCDVDIVDADAGAADHLEIGRLLEQRLGHLGRRAHGEPVELADDALQILGRQAGHQPGPRCRARRRIARPARAQRGPPISTFAMVSLPDESDGVWLLFLSRPCTQSPPPRPSPIEGEGDIRWLPVIPSPLWGRVRVGGETRTDLSDTLRRLRLPQLAIGPVEPGQQRLEYRRARWCARPRSAGPAVRRDGRRYRRRRLPSRGGRRIS